MGLLSAGKGEREARFQALKREAATAGGSSGSFFAFHGSAPGNWHGILRLGLKNMSGITQGCNVVDETRRRRWMYCCSVVTLADGKACNV